VHLWSLMLAAAESAPFGTFQTNAMAVAKPQILEHTSRAWLLASMTGAKTAVFHKMLSLCQTVKALEQSARLKLKPKAQ
jgi:hypothetical protein